MLQQQMLFPLLLLLLSSSLLIQCDGFHIDSIISPMRSSLLRTLQLDKEEWKEDIKQQQLLNNDDYDMSLNTRQKRLLNNYKKSISDRSNVFGFTSSSEVINGRIAMASFIICFFVEEVTDESILDQIGLLEHSLHISLFMLILTFMLQPMIDFFKDDTK